MAREASYRILDEPGPSALAHLIVHPMWPLLSIMFAGAWLAVPWFVLNSFALGSHTRFKELGVAAGGVLGVLALAFGLGLIHTLLKLPEGAIPYLRVLVILWKLSVAYWLFDLQKHTFSLHEYFGGAVRNGMLVVGVGYLLRGSVLKVPFGGAGLWQLVVG
ncbi:MAG: hypothetical protein JXB05_15865 [Myxococcaceae bacterium]|nr:hypothetical protein [Myxococcaceae bacterium]